MIARSEDDRERKKMIACGDAGAGALQRAGHEEEASPTYGVHERVT